MAGGFKYLEPTFRRLGGKAKPRGVELHRSAIVELQNYVLRQGTRQLTRPTKRKVVEVVLSDIIEQAARSRGPAQRIDARTVRGYLDDICTDPFGNCLTAAQQVVEEFGKPAERRLLESFLAEEVDDG